MAADIEDAKIYAIIGDVLLDRDWNWPLPSDQGPGDWMPAYEGELEPWKISYPLCHGAEQLLDPSVRFGGASLLVITQGNVARRSRPFNLSSASVAVTITSSPFPNTKSSPPIPCAMINRRSEKRK